MEERKHRRRKIFGCLTLCLTPISLAVGLYFLLYYNPMRLVDRRSLAATIENGLLAECDALLAQKKSDGYYRLPANQWPKTLVRMQPRGVFVSTGSQVSIELWKNYREWEDSSILGIWTAKGGCGISLIVCSREELSTNLERGNSDPQCPYYTRKVAERVYLEYPKRLQREVAKHTDLFHLDAASRIPTVEAVIAVGSSSEDIISFVESGRCAQAMLAQGARFTKLTANQQQGSHVLEIRTEASNERDALTATGVAIETIRGFTKRNLQLVTGPMVVQ
jgi:hypothetical protein